MRTHTAKAKPCVNLRPILSITKDHGFTEIARESANGKAKSAIRFTRHEVDELVNALADVQTLEAISTKRGEKPTPSEFEISKAGKAEIVGQWFPREGVTLIYTHPENGDPLQVPVFIPIRKLDWLLDRLASSLGVE